MNGKKKPRDEFGDRIDCQHLLISIKYTGFSIRKENRDMRFSRYRILQLPLKQGYILHTCHRLNSSIIIPIYYGAFKIIIAHILDTNNKKSPIFALLWVKYGGFFHFTLTLR